MMELKIEKMDGWNRDERAWGARIGVTHLNENNAKSKKLSINWVHLSEIRVVKMGEKLGTNCVD